jgi:hypothetical protein
MVQLWVALAEPVDVAAVLLHPAQQHTQHTLTKFDGLQGWV